MSHGDEIDWSTAPIVPPWPGRTLYAEAVSQLLHGEHLAGRICARIAERLDADDPARKFITTQQADEARHEALYARYLVRLGEKVCPIDPALDFAGGAILGRTTTTEHLFIACHVLLEGEAMRLHGELTRALPCPLMRAINRRVAQDEARHGAFGRTWLRGRIARSDRTRRRDAFRWAASLWEGMAAAGPPPERGAGAFAGSRRAAIAARWSHHAAVLKRMGIGDD